MSYSHRADWYPLIAGYVAHLKAASLRPETIRLYRGWLWRAAAELPAPTTVRQRHVEAWLGEHDWAPETRKSIRTALRGFFRWLFEEGIIAGTNLRAVQVALGHRTVNTTQRYVRADYSAVRAAVLSA